MTEADDAAAEKAADIADSRRIAADAGIESAEQEQVAPERLEVVEVRQGAFGVHGTPDVSGYGGLRTVVALKPAAERPYGEWFDGAADTLVDALGQDAYSAAVERVVVDRDELTFEVRREHLIEFLRTMRDDPSLRFELLSGVSGVHYPGDAGRELHAVYHLTSMTHRRRVRVETTCPDPDPHIPSCTGIYPTANWHERETFDFFGSIFDDHPGLTRIEMPDDWVGHPQRKDYPLGGIPVEYKGATIPPPDQRRSYS